MNTIKIANSIIGEGYPAYFIADIAANHDGEIERAKKLIYLAKECGADAVKFQHFRAENIVSDIGFRKLGGNNSHQKNWHKSVFQVYKDASISWEWTSILKEYSDKVEIEFFSSPYDIEIIDHLNPYVNAFKIGSGDITWLEILEKVANTSKPVILATGASDLIDVQRAVNTITKTNNQLALLQCNTNYTGNIENIKYVSLNVLKLYKSLYPDLVLGISDHTPGHVTVLGAIALGSKIVEKHFTDDNTRTGPDHSFSMNPVTWKSMINDSKFLESSLGNHMKIIEENEREAVIVQRRCICAQHDLMPGHIISREDLDVLRPAPLDSIMPYYINNIIGLTVKNNVKSGEALNWKTFK